MGECASVEAEHLVPVAAARAPVALPGWDVVGWEGWIWTMCPALPGELSLIRRASAQVVTFGPGDSCIEKKSSLAMI